MISQQEKRYRESDRKYQAKKRVLGLVDKTEEYRIWREKHPGGSRAQHIVNNLIRKGIIKREKCHLCRQPKTHAHHENYNEPLNIIWLCPSCHQKYHRGLVDIIIKKKFVKIKKRYDKKLS